MAGTNTPGPSGRLVQRMVQGGATSGLAAGHARGSVGGGMPRSGGGGGGGNPIARGSADEPVPVQDVPIHGLGTAMLNLALHPIMQARADEETQRRDDYAASSPKTQAVQDAMDAYMQARAGGGTGADIMARLFHPDSQGHVHFANPDAFNAIMGVHKAMEGVAGETPQIQQIGGHEVLMANGKATLVPPTKAAAGANTVHMVNGLPYIKDPSDPSGLRPMHANAGGQGDSSQFGQGAGVTGTGQATGPGGFALGKAKALTSSESQEIGGLERVMPALEQLQAHVGATGFGTSAMGHMIGKYTNWDAPEMRAAWNSLDNAKASIASAEQGSSRLKAVYQDIQNQLPTDFSSEPANRDKLAQLQLQLRTAIGGLSARFQAEGKDTSEIQPLVDRYNANPALMQKVNDTLHQLRADPTSVSNNDLVQMYAGETFHRDQSFALPKADGLAVMGEMERRNLWNARNDIIKAYPDHAYLPDQQMMHERYAQELQAHAAKYGPTPATANAVATGMPTDQTTGPAPMGLGQGAGGQPAPDQQQKVTPLPPAPKPPQPPAEGGPPTTELPPVNVPSMGALPGKQSSVLDSLNPIQTAQAAERPPMAPDTGAAAGASTQLTDQDRQLLADISARGDKALQSGPPAAPAAPSGNQEGVTIPLPPKEQPSGSTQ